MYAGSSCIVSTSTRASGAARASCSMVWVERVPGMDRSRSTTCGMVVWALWTLSGPLPASPTTSMSDWALMSIFRPARRTAWSSATSTRILGMEALYVAEGEVRQDRGARSGLRFDRDTATEQGCALPHAPEAEPSAVPRREARAIILDAHQTNPHAPRPRMSRHIGQGLLQHTIDGGLHKRRQGLPIQPVDPHVHRNPVQPGEVLNVPGERRGAPYVIEDSRVQPPRESSYFVQSLGGDPAEPLRQLGCVCDRPGLLDRPQPHEERRERLPGLVVQLTGDPPSLLLLGGQRLLDQPIAELLRPLAFADVRDHRSEE